MSFQPNPDDVRCLNCHQWLNKSLRVCPKCEAPNVPRTGPPPKPEKSKKPSRVKALLVSLKIPSPSVEIPADQVHIATELTSQYRLLVIWQIVGLLLILDGPILLLFLYFTGLLPIIEAASVLFPVAVAVFPGAVMIGLIYAAIRKPSLRQRIAEMGVSAGDWARPMERPIRQFWIATAIFTAAILFLAAILSAVRGYQERRGHDLTQRTSPTLYEWEFQKRR